MELVFVVTALLLFSEGLRGAQFENAILSMFALVMFAAVLSHMPRAQQRETPSPCSPTCTSAPPTPVLSRSRRHWHPSVWVNEPDERAFKRLRSKRAEVERLLKLLDEFSRGPRGWNPRHL